MATTIKDTWFNQQAKTSLESVTRNQNSNLGCELRFYNHLKLKPDKKLKGSKD